MTSVVVFDEDVTSYHGRREKIAVILVGAQRIKLTLADTARCAVDLDSARRTLQALLGDRMTGHAEGAESGLQAKCRELTKWKERKPRY